jgi:hypothetical protein
MARPITIGAYETAERASLQMCEKGVGALIVRGGDAGWGIATRGDLLRAGFQAGEEEGLFFCAACGSLGSATTSATQTSASVSDGGDRYRRS